jgi:hypothetical protein
MLGEEPLAIHSLHFDWGGGAIALWDPVTGARLGEQPEWIRGRRSEPVAYVRGARPAVQVTLLANHYVPTDFTLSAFGPALCPGEGPVRWLGPHPVQLERTAGWNTLPEPVPFQRPLPRLIGLHALELRWYAEWTDAGGEARKLFLGETYHEVCTTGAPLEEGLPGAPPSGMWAPLMRWSSRWCAGLEGPKAVCDAILQGLPETRLQYGLPAWTVRHMLVAGGGMCGAWYQLFPLLAGCQGVPVEGRTLRLVADSRTDEGPWEALVATAPGINQLQHSRHTRFHGRFNDCERYPFPADAPVELLGRHESRYCFPAGPSDGHCVNFLRDGGRLYLYDACFHTRAVELDMALPEADGPPVRLGPESPLRRDYLHGTMPWLMGSLRANGRRWEVDLARGEFGVTVRTEQVPELSLQWSL